MNDSELIKTVRDYVDEHSECSTESGDYCSLVDDLRYLLAKNPPEHDEDCITQCTFGEKCRIWHGCSFCEQEPEVNTRPSCGVPYCANLLVITDSGNRCRQCVLSGRR